METREILEMLKEDKISIEEAESYFKRKPFEDMGYAKIDSHRKIRSGFGEVVFCSGNSVEPLVKIFMRIYEDEGEVMGTRASA